METFFGDFFTRDHKNYLVEKSKIIYHHKYVNYTKFEIMRNIVKKALLEPKFCQKKAFFFNFWLIFDKGRDFEMRN